MSLTAISSATSSSQLQQLFAKLDTDKSGGVDASELATAAANSTGATSDAFTALSEALSSADSDGNGSLSGFEFGSAFDQLDSGTQATLLSVQADSGGTSTTAASTAATASAASDDSDATSASAGSAGAGSAGGAGGSGTAKEVESTSTVTNPDGSTTTTITYTDGTTSTATTPPTAKSDSGNDAGSQNDPSTASQQQGQQQGATSSLADHRVAAAGYGAQQAMSTASVATVSLAA